MKPINSALGKYLIAKCAKGHLFVEGLLRRGSATIFQSPRLVDEMVYARTVEAATAIPVGMEEKEFGFAAIKIAYSRMLQ